MANKVKYGLKNVHVFPIYLRISTLIMEFITLSTITRATKVILSQHSFQTLLNSLSLIILRIPRELSLRIQVQNLVTSEWHSSSKVM